MVQISIEEWNNRFVVDGQFRVERPGWNWKTRFYSKEDVIKRAQEVLEKYKEDNYVLLINDDSYIAAVIWREPRYVYPSPKS